MSTQQPGSQPGQPEYLGDEPATSKKKSRWPLAAGGAVVAVGLIGAAAWGVTQFLSDSTTPAQAVPASALGYISVDLDPGKGQQLEAYQTLKKFPAIADKVGSSDDLRETLFNAIKEDAGCDDLDFGDDVEPWLGNSVAFAAIPGEGDGAEPVPFAVVEVKDQGAAEDGFAKLEACGDSSGDSSSDDSGAYDFTGDYAVFAETSDDVDAVLAAVDEGTLADDSTFQSRVDDAGGAGFMTGYAAPEAADAIVAEAKATQEEAGLPAGGDTEMMEKALADFDGAAMSLRFDSGAMKLTAAGQGLVGDDLAGALGGDSGVTDLPDSTIAAYGLPVGPDLVQTYIDFLTDYVGEDEVQMGISQIEQATGLSVPEDLQTLLGDGLAVSVDSSADFAGLTSGATAPTELPAGIRINGDPAEIRPVLEQALTAAGAPPGAVTIEDGDNAVAVSFSPDYAATLAGNGGLGESSAFTKVLPDLSEDSGVLYVSFDGDWLSNLVTSFPVPDAEEVKANLEPLGALGISSTMNDDGSFEMTMQLTTD